MMLQMAYFDRDRDPVHMDIGPVLDLRDVAGGKICALAGRVEPRDYADTAGPRQLLAGVVGNDCAALGWDLAADREDVGSACPVAGVV